MRRAVVVLIHAVLSDRCWGCRRSKEQNGIENAGVYFRYFRRESERYWRWSESTIFAIKLRPYESWTSADTAGPRCHLEQVVQTESKHIVEWRAPAKSSVGNINALVSVCCLSTRLQALLWQLIVRKQIGGIRHHVIWRNLRIILSLHGIQKVKRNESDRNVRLLTP